jgi:hypothetical protein
MSRLGFPPFVALGALALAGCGNSDDGYRAAYRTRSVQACVTGARQSPTAPDAIGLGIDFQHVCECAVDRHIAQTPIEQLRGEEGSTTEPPGATEAMRQCLIEQMRRAPVPGGAAPGKLPPAPPEPPKPGG